MQPIAQTPKPLKAPVRFGSTGGSGGIGGVTGALDTAFQLFQNSRGKEMIIEDVVGFGALRTGMDLHRNKMYGDDSWNVPAAAERFGREISSIITDSVLGGVMAWGMSKAIFDRKNQAFSKEFIQYPSLELFQDIVNAETLKSAKNPEAAQKAFIQELSKRLPSSGDSQARQNVLKVLKAAWQFKPAKRSAFEKGTSWLRANPNAETFNQKAKTLVESFQNGSKNFDLNINTNLNPAINAKAKAGGLPQAFQANDLLDDVNRFGRFMEKAGANKATDAPLWQEVAHKAITRTRTAKNWSIPIGLAAGMGTTFVMPFVSNYITKKWFNIDYFPGETSLRKNQPQMAPTANTEPKSRLERYFPYVKQATQNGNPLPLALALAPLLAAFGCVDTYKLSSSPLNSLINPIKGLKNGTLKKLFDFSKAAPFTSQQQMAAMFALLITSRLLSSRSDNEYKERVLDSAVGWVAWIVGTPLLKKGLSKLSQHKELFNANGSLQSREALQAFSSKALPAQIRIGMTSTVATMGILGLGAPYAGIKLTQWNEKRKQLKAANLPPMAAPLQRKGPTAFPTQSPAGLFTPPSPLPVAPFVFGSPQAATWSNYSWQQPQSRP